MTPEQKAAELGITFPEQKPGYLNLCVKTGNLLITSGHVSDQKGVLGKGLTVEQGYAAARDCAVKILRSVKAAHGTLDGLRVDNPKNPARMNVPIFHAAGPTKIVVEVMTIKIGATERNALTTMNIVIVRSTNAMTTKIELESTKDIRGAEARDRHHHNEYLV